MSGNYSLRYDPAATPGLASTTVFPVLDVAPPATTGFHETAGVPVAFATISQIATLLSTSPLGPITTPAVTITQGTVTALAQGITQTVTWNNAAVTFVGQDFNATDTASNAASILAQWRKGGTIQVQIDKNGNQTNAGFLQCGNASALIFGNRSRLYSSVNGNVNLTNATATSFTRLTLGNETALSPSLKVNGAGITIIAGDNSTAATLGVTGAVGIGGAATATSKLNITGLPTSSAGLAAGDVYSNAGILTIV